jgi:Na+:H+ antiporter, NhaC family
VNSSAIGLNVTAGDQYVADVLPARMFRVRVPAPGPRARGAQPRGRGLRHRDLADGAVDTCGAYMSGVLGVPTATYLPCCFFNLLSPILDVIYGYLGFKVATIPPAPDGAAPGEPNKVTTAHPGPTRRWRRSPRGSSWTR